MKVSTILTTKRQLVVTIPPDQTVATAVKLLQEYDIGALLVVDANEKLVGILSERDVVRHLPNYDQILPVPVHTLMTTAVITAVPQDDLMSVAHTMTEKHIRHLPVVERGKLVGIISIGDVLKAQRDQYLGEIDTLETQIMAE